MEDAPVLKALLITLLESAVLALKLRMLSSPMESVQFVQEI